METLSQYGYVGIAAALIGSGFGLPIPEELPIITAGILVGHEDTSLRWWIMLPVAILACVIGDSLLYGIGRWWGPTLLEKEWVKRRLIPPEKREEIIKNFHERGIAVLLGARLLPGIRTPIFIMAGVLKVPLGRFVIADGLYAIPGINILFWLSYSLTDQVLEVFNKIEQYRPLVMVAVLSAVAGVIGYKYLVSRKVATGNPSELPNIISKPGDALSHAIEKTAEMTIEKAMEKTGEVIEKVTHPSKIGKIPEAPQPSPEKG